MVNRVVVTAAATKDLSKVPSRIGDKFYGWVRSVKLDGLDVVRKIPGFHDEPLKGKRKGQRSIRLSGSYRAIYKIEDDGVIEFVSVKEVNNHEY